jgi:hypothetical protein
MRTAEQSTTENGRVPDDEAQELPDRPEADYLYRDLRAAGLDADEAAEQVREAFEQADEWSGK